MKLSMKLIKELMESGCEYDEAVRLVEEGIRIKRVETKHLNKRKVKDESKHNRP